LGARIASGRTIQFIFISGWLSSREMSLADTHSPPVDDSEKAQRVVSGGWRKGRSSSIHDADLSSPDGWADR